MVLLKVRKLELLTPKLLKTFRDLLETDKFQM